MLAETPWLQMPRFTADLRRDHDHWSASNSASNLDEGTHRRAHWLHDETL
jgi:hypothetical protein